MRKADPYSVAMLLVIVGVSILRAVFASMVDLAPDEAYYWTWSTHLAAGYFDHPPAVAWLIRLGTMLLGHSTLGVRLGAILCIAATSWLIYVLARRIGPSSAWAFGLAVLVTLSPLLSTGAVIHTPDAALALFWAFATWAALKAFETNLTKFWVLLGVAVGFALLAKASALLLIAGIGLYAVSCKAGKDCLNTSGPVIGLALAALVASPNMVWNIRHHGGSLLFQTQHATGALAFRPLGPLEFILGQAGVLSPLLFVAVAAFLAIGWRRRVRFGYTEAYLVWCLSAPLLLVTLLLSFVHKVEVNWPAAGHISAVVGVAWALSGGWWYLKRRRLWLALSVALGLFMTLAIHAQALWQVIPLDSRYDATARLRGWRVMAEKAVALADSLHASIASEGYGPVSELSFYTQRPVAYERSSTRASQYDLWPDKHPARRLLFVQPRTTKGLPSLCKGATKVSDVSPAQKQQAGSYDKSSEFRWWLCEGVGTGSMKGAVDNHGRDKDE